MSDVDVRPSRRGFILGSLAALGATVPINRAFQAREEKKIAELERTAWTPAIKVLDGFLKTHTDKHVVAYWIHSSTALQDFYKQDAFWSMLKANGFTDSFLEIPTHLQPELDLAAGARVNGAEFSYLGPINVAAARHGIKSTATDRGDPSLPTKYDAVIASMWDMYKANNNITYADTPEQVRKEVNDQAAYVREQLKHEGAWQHYEEDKMWKYSRTNDEATGTLSAELSAKAKGRVWQSQGSGHFSDCGLDTYIPGSLVIQIYADRLEMAQDEAMRDNSDVFVVGSPAQARAAHFAFLVKEGEMIAVEEEVPKEMRDDARAECIMENHDVDAVRYDDEIEHANIVKARKNAVRPDTAPDTKNQFPALKK